MQGKDRLNIMTDLCMNDAVLVQCSVDRPNIYFLKFVRCQKTFKSGHPFLMTTLKLFGYWE